MSADVHAPEIATSTPASQRAHDDTARFDHPMDDPTLARTAVTNTSHHTALGFRLRYDTNDLGIHAAVLESFGPDTPWDDDAAPDAHVQLFRQHVDEAPDFRPRQPVVRSYGSLFSITASRASVVSGDASQGRAMGFLSPTTIAYRDFLRVAFVQTAFFQIAQPRSLVAIHAATLWKDDRALMLRGDSGAGKSTLCYAALRQGWSLIGEDVAYLRTRTPHTTGPVDPDNVDLYGLPWNLHLLPDTVRFFPELREQLPHERPDGRMKVCVLVDHQFPGQVQHRAPLCPIVFVEREVGGVPRVRRVGCTEARERLRATAIHYEQEAQRDYAVWDAFLTQPCYVLSGGDDPLANALLLEDL